ncbi:MAG: outer membrane lipoprotein chaperone LolA, partial [Proteobacteria bacterium]|nr:outer membrane lipoprotein chaperone LolA [Pseudomonadota bacterium]
MFSARIAPLLATACFALMGPAIAAAGDRAGIELLRNYLNGLESFSAAFAQERYDEYGELLETASGRCLVKRPGRFRWSYTSPYLQLIVGDGDTLWIYDEDLEQVTVNPMGEIKAGSPAELLGGGLDVESRY